MDQPEGNGEYRVVGDYDFLMTRENRLGKGGQASVFRGRHTRTKEEAAVRIVDITSPSSKTNFRREIANITSINSPYIIKFLHYEESNDRAYVVTEYVKGGTLQMLMAQLGIIPIEAAWRWLRQLTSGLHEVWRNGVAHRDVKPGNILLTVSDVTADIKLCDFGISKKVTNEEGKTKIGTPKYMAPEMTGAVKYRTEVDVYALGVVFYEMLFGRIPLKILDIAYYDQMLVRIRDSRHSEFVKNILRHMLKREGRERISPTELVFWLRFNSCSPIKATPIYNSSRGTDSVSSKPVIIKAFASSESRSGRQEIQCLFTCCSSSVVQLYESSDDGLKLLLEDYACTLQEFLKGIIVTPELARQWMRKLLTAVQEVHKQNIVIVNLCPETIVLDRNEHSAKFKLADFHRAVIQGDEPRLPPENWAYCPPETFNRAGCTPAMDVWNLGCVLYFLLRNQELVQAQSQEQATAGIQNLQVRIQELDYVPEPCRKLLEGMLQVDPAQRFTVERCLNHEFFRDPMDVLVTYPQLFRNNREFDAVLKSGLAMVTSCCSENDVAAVMVLCSLLLQAVQKYCNLQADNHYDPSLWNAYLLEFTQFSTAQRTFARVSWPWITEMDLVDVACKLYDSNQQQYYKMMSLVKLILKVSSDVDTERLKVRRV